MGREPSAAGQVPEPTTSNAGAAELKRAELGRRLRERFTWLNRFNDEELQEISMCETGAPVQAGKLYFDVSHPENGVFVGRADLIVPEGACLVDQDSLSPRLWEKLTRAATGS